MKGKIELSAAKRLVTYGSLNRGPGPATYGSHYPPRDAVSKRSFQVWLSTGKSRRLQPCLTPWRVQCLVCPFQVPAECTAPAEPLALDSPARSVDRLYISTVCLICNLVSLSRLDQVCDNAAVVLPSGSLACHLY